MHMSKKRTLFWDIETGLLSSWHFSLGEQVMRHNQLVSKQNVKPKVHLPGKVQVVPIICISYMWDTDTKATTIFPNKTTLNSKNMLVKFDKLLNRADVVIGKNSDSFDVKHLNTHRLLHRLPGNPTWARWTDDLEKQLRKHFRFPSQSLDYVSNLLGIGGKEKMEFGDWVAIMERRCHKAFKKFGSYNRKDVEDTKAIWDYARTHFEARDESYHEGVCSKCGSSKLVKYGTRKRGATIYQRWFCNDHGGFSKDAPVKRGN